MILDQFSDLQLIQKGAQAAVYRAIDTFTGKFVAIKMYHESLVNSEKARLRIGEELRL